MPVNIQRSVLSDCICAAIHCMTTLIHTTYTFGNDALCLCMYFRCGARTMLTIVRRCERENKKWNNRDFQSVDHHHMFAKEMGRASEFHRNYLCRVAWKEFRCCSRSHTAIARAYKNFSFCALSARLSVPLRGRLQFDVNARTKWINQFNWHFVFVFLFRHSTK